MNNWSKAKDTVIDLYLDVIHHPQIDAFFIMLVVNFFVVLFFIGTISFFYYLGMIGSLNQVYNDAYDNGFGQYIWIGKNTEFRWKADGVIIPDFVSEKERKLWTQEAIDSRAKRHKNEKDSLKTFERMEAIDGK